MANLVLDLSHWQGDVNFKEIAASGTIGVILKATQGTGYIDPMYEANKKAAHDAGLLVSAYHFLEHGNVQAQMEHFMDVAALPRGYRLCIDFEANPDGQDATLTDLETAVEILREYDWELTVYGGSSHLKGEIPNYNRVLAANTSLWIAHYTDAKQPSWPTATWPQWSLWQWTQEGSNPGVNGDVDCNRWNGSEDGLRDWFVRPKHVQPGPKPSPLVTVDISVPDDVTVVVYINGEMH